MDPEPPESSSDQSLALVASDEILPKPKPKRPKLSEHEEVYLQNLPACEAYERSYMHRDLVSHVQVTKNQFLITASVDGVVKFWKKTPSGIEFVKSFKSHTGPVEDLAVTCSGSELASISRKDKSAKIFDVVNFDMINMFSLNFEPRCVEWIKTAATEGENLLISDSQTCKIYTFDAKQPTSEPKRVLEHLHSAVVCRIRWNQVYGMAVSADVDGVVEYWRTDVNFGAKSKIKIDAFCNTDTTGDRVKVQVHSITFSPSGQVFATTSSDRRIRLFRFKTGEVLREYDESLERLVEEQKEKPFMSSMDFARRLAIERELDKSSLASRETVVFDQSGTFILYPTMLGVKIYNWKTNRYLRSIGREETNFRPLCISLFQGLIFERVVRKFNIDSLRSGVNDPTLYCCAYKKNRFYCFSNRYFEEETTEGEPGAELIKDRDIFNEKPTREEMMAAIEIEQLEREQVRAEAAAYENATMFTTMGDIHLRLFPKQAPKTCENFCSLARGNYYNNHIFHRVISQFMIQTGDPTGTGTGGESVWGDDFEDEFCDDLKHDKPFTLSMANRGPNTNGSQFFITVVPCPFLDRKHTVFGRVVRGMDTCTAISKIKTDPKTDKPFNDVKIINIKVF